MPTIIVKSREDRGPTVNLQIEGRKGKEQYVIEREKPIFLSKEAYQVLKDSYEGPYVEVIKE